MPTDPIETGGWVIDKNNPNRAVYTDENGNEYEAFRQEQPKAEAPAATTVNTSSSLERFTDSYREGSQYGAPGLIARKAYEALGYSPEAVAQAQKTIREDAIKAQEQDPIFRKDDTWLQTLGILDRDDGSNPLEQGGSYLAGQMLGGIGPEALFMPGGSAFARTLGQTIIGGVSDAGYQLKEALDGVREEISLAEVGLGAALGGGFQGVVETSPFIKKLFLNRGKDTTPSATPVLTDETRTAYDDLVKTGSIDELNAFLEQHPEIQTDRQGLADFVAARDAGKAVDPTVRYENQLAEEAANFQGSRDPTAEELFAPKPQRPLAEEAADFQPTPEPTPESIFGEAAPAPSREPTAEDLFGATDTPVQDIPTQAVDETLTKAQQHVEGITADWTNRPDIEIVGSNKSMAEAYPDVAPDAVGVITPEGKVVINLEQVRAEAQSLGVPEESVLSSVTFHEALGHYGLSQRFGDDLDNTLTDLYNNSAWFEREVNRWMEANPEAYVDSDNRIARAADEVFAEMSEKGAVPKPVMNKLRQWLKDFARSMGLNLDISEREVRAILAASHASVINGVRQDVTGNGFRHMFAGENAINAPRYDDPRWFTAPDGLRRFEIDDSQASLNHRELEDASFGNEKTLGQVLDHPELFEAYPELRDVKVGFRGRIFDLWGNTMGWFDSKKNELVITPNGKMSDRLSTALHEVQHWIQNNEGFAKGGNSETALSKAPFSKLVDTAEGLRQSMVDAQTQTRRRIEQYNQALDGDLDRRYAEADRENNKAYTEYSRDRDNEQKRLAWRATSDRLKEIEHEFVTEQGYNSYFDLPDEVAMDVSQRKVLARKHPETLKARREDEYKSLEKAGQKIEELDDALDPMYFDDENSQKKHLVDILKEDQGISFRAYESLFGEVEARAVQKRKDMTPSQRQDADPYADTGVEPEDYIFDYEGPQAESRSELWDDAPNDPDRKPSRRQIAERKGFHKMDDRNRYAKMADDFEREQSYRDNRYMRRSKTDKSEANRVGGVNLDNIQKVEDIDYFLGRAKEMAENNGENFDPVTRAETVRMGRDLGLTSSKVLKPGMSEEGLASRIDAGMQVLVNQLAKVEKISNRISTNGSSARDTLALSKEMTTLAAVYARVSGNNSEVGRALNILNRMRQATGNADDLLRYMKLHGNTVFSNPQHVQQLAQMVQQAGTPAQKVKIIQAAMQPKAEDYIFRAYYNMMLSNPATHTTNFVGTGMNFMTDLLENTGAAIIGQRNRGGNLDRVRGREVMYRLYGALRGFSDAATWANTRNAFATAQVGGQSTAKTGNSNVYTGSDPMKGFLSGLFESPTRALAGSDEFWRNVLQASNLHGLAVRNAGNKGLTGKAFWKEVNRLILQPTKEMIEATENYTKVLQFMDKPSFIAEGLIRAQTIGPKAGVPERVGKSVLKFAVPFVRTPDALIRTAIRRSPIGFERENINGWKAGGAERDKVIARLTIGSALAFFVASQAFEGNINGDGPKDYQKRNAWMGRNLPNSIKIGDDWHSIQGLEPVSTNILGIATLVERYKAGEISHDDYVEAAYSAVHGIASVLSENSYMESFNQLMKIFSGDPKQEETAMTNFMASMASSLTTPAILRGYSRSVDTAVRDTTGDGSLTDRLYGRIASGVPGLSETLPQRSDVYGRPQSRDILGSAMFTRSDTKAEETDPAVLEIARLEDSSEKLILGAPSKSGIKVNGEKRRLNAEEFQMYQALSGYWITSAVNQYMTDPEWATLSDNDKIEVIKDTTNQARKAAREYLFDPEDDQPEEDE